VRRSDVALDIYDIVIDALYHLSLLGNHIGELSKDLAKLSDGGFDGLNGIRPLLDI